MDPNKEVYNKINDLLKSTDQTNLETPNFSQGRNSLLKNAQDFQTPRFEPVKHRLNLQFLD